MRLTGPQADSIMQGLFGVALQLHLMVDMVDDEVRTRLAETIEIVDETVNELRSASLPQRVADAVSLVVAPVTENSRSQRRLLCRFDDRSTFAYARGHDFIRCADETLWAHLSDGVLLSARSGEPLGYQVGTVFYDYQTRRPIYYQPT